jgi:alpha-methylacyl-CoA racemase
MRGALENITVLELCVAAPGKYCGMILGDMGADVLTVDQVPKEKDASDFEGNVCGWNMKELSVILNDTFNRNKMSITLNLKSEDGRRIFYRLAEKADVVIEGFRPGTAERLGVNYGKIAEINPRIVYCSISGYGQNGPYKTMPGHDLNYVAMASAFSAIGVKDGPPIWPLNVMGDWAGGSLNAAIGIIAALLSREHTGKGQYVDIAMTDGVISLMNFVIYDYFNNHREWKRGEAPFNGGFPSLALYMTKDGEYISIGCMEPWFWEKLCSLLGVEEYIPYQWVQGKKREEIFKCFKEIFLTKSRDEWFEILIENDICAGKVYSVGELNTDPQVTHRKMLVEIEHPVKGKVKQVGNPIKLSDTPGDVNRRPISLPGQHNEQVLIEYGFTKEDLQRFYEAGVISKYEVG